MKEGPFIIRMRPPNGMSVRVLVLLTQSVPLELSTLPTVILYRFLLFNFCLTAVIIKYRKPAVPETYMVIRIWSGKNRYVRDRFKTGIRWPVSG